MKIGGQIPWNVTPFCETFKIYCLMRRHHMKGGSENHSTDQLSRLEQWSNITLFLRKTNLDCISLEQKYCQVYSSVTSSMAVGIWKGDITVADTEELEEMDASELHARRLKAKEVLTPMRGEHFIFPVADGTVKISGGDQDLRTSTLIRDSPDRGEEQDNLRGESDGSSSNPRQDSSYHDGEAKSDFWSISGDFIYRYHVDHSRRERLMSSSSQEPRASGKPDALLSSRSDGPGNQFENSILKFADPSNFGKSLLDGNKDHLTVVSMSFSNKLMLKDWKWRTPITEGESASRDSDTQYIHEMGEMKRAQALRVDEFSVQKLRESHETIQWLTS